MSKKNSKLAAILIGPALVVGGILALWENEGRFNYYEAARDATVITSPSQREGEPISFTSELDTTIPIAGEYIRRFNGYHIIKRKAQIYSWDESKDSEGDTTWRLGWYSSLDNNSRNRDLHQELTSEFFYPDRYSLGGLEVSPANIHFVDGYNNVPFITLELTQKASDLGLVRRNGYLYMYKGRADNLGDERISYEGIPNAPVASYFGEITGGKGIGRRFEENSGFISEIIANDGFLHHLVNGERDTSLIKIERHFTRTVWFTRLGGTVAIIVGINIFLSSFVSLLYRIPLVGNLLKEGVFVVSLVLGLPIALFVMLSGLIAQHTLGFILPLMVIGGGVYYFMRGSRTTQKNAKKTLSIRLSQRERESAVSPLQADASVPVGSNRLEAGQYEEPFVFEVEPDENIASKEQQAIDRTFVQLATVAMAEEGLNKRETKMLTAWGRENGVSKARMKALITEAKGSEVDTGEASRTDLELLACMAMVDGALSRGEWKLLAKMAERVGVSGQELRNIIGNIDSGRWLTA